MPSRFVDTIAFLVCLTALFHVSVSEQGCPPKSEIEPCSCYEGSAWVELSCRDLDDIDVLSKVFQNAQRYNFTKFTLTDSTLQYIPHIIFDDVTIKVIIFEHVSFVNTFDAVPHDPGVKEIYVKRVRVMRGWDWEKVSDFKNLEEVYIEDVPLRSLSTDFSSHVTKSLKLFKCEWCELKKFKGEEFKDLLELESLTVSMDAIPSISRSLFPKPSKLKTLDFSYNKISTLPDDIFTDMPYLQTLNLGSNQLAVLPEESFKPIIGTLAHLHLGFNPIKCDCRLEWIFHNQHIGISGKCEAPKDLNGKDIGRLQPEDFRC